MISVCYQRFSFLFYDYHWYPPTNNPCVWCSELPRQPCTLHQTWMHFYSAGMLGDFNKNCRVKFVMTNFSERSQNKYWFPSKIPCCYNKANFCNTGFEYIGLQNGDNCLCGISYGMHGPASHCNVPCVGDSPQICGGYYMNSVWSVTSPTGKVSVTDYWPLRFTKEHCFGCKLEKLRPPVHQNILEM